MSFDPSIDDSVAAGGAASAGKKNRGGRPPLADADRRETLVRVLTTEAEYEELQLEIGSVGGRRQRAGKMRWPKRE